MNQAFYTGITGLQTHQYGIDTTADNLANINTVGYRSYTAEFSSLFESTYSEMGARATNENTIGYGAQVNASSMDMHQGSLITTGSATDLAISGNGWFGVTGNGNTYFTRAGNFNYDAIASTVSTDPNAVLNRLVSPEGYFLTGTSANNFAYNPDFQFDGATKGSYVVTQQVDAFTLDNVAAQGPLALPLVFAYPPERTTTATFFGNLGLEDTTRAVHAQAISPNGDRNDIVLTFTQSETQPTEGVSWEVTAEVRSVDGTVYDTQSGTVVFAANGGLISNNLPSLDNDGGEVALDLGTDYSGIFSNGSEDIGMDSTSDGFEPGNLSGYTISDNGQIVATFSNGRQTIMGQIAVYHFANDQGLERISGTHFAPSSNSGEPIFYTDADGNYMLDGPIMTHTLENANVRMEIGMTELIIMQRAYSANAKSITTGDELIQKALQMDA